MFDTLSAMRKSSETLSSESNESPKLSSTSAVFHNAPGICPKCSGQMIVTGSHMDKLFFCTKCRVALPMPNDLD